MDRDRIRQVETDFFQGRSEQAVDSALEIIASLDMDDDDEAQVAADLIIRAVSSDRSVDFINRLRESGFDFGVRFPDGETMTTLYASRGRSDPSVLAAFAEAGADLFSCNRNGSNALHLLAAMERSNWAKDRETDMAAVARIPADVSEWMTCNAFGATPLHLAVMNRHSELLSAMLESSLDVNATGSEIRQGYGHAIDFNGVTALDVACLIGDDVSARTLINHGADPSLTDNRGRSAAHYAVSPPPVSVCREWDSVPGMEAVVGRKKAILAMVGDPNVTDDAGFSPLMMTLTSYRYQNGGLSVALLQLGADPNLALNDGTTPLMAASSNGHGDAVKALIAAGAELDSCDRRGRTALHHAISWRDEKSARLLVKKGARFDIPDEGGVTAGEMAASAGMESVMDLMLRGD